MIEAEVLGRLNHPGIAQIIEAGTADFGECVQPYLAMELVDGPALLDYVRERGLNTSHRLRLFVKICDAVQHAHQKGVIHRDLKPANILIVEQPQQSPGIERGYFKRSVLEGVALTSRGSFGCFEEDGEVACQCHTLDLR